MHKVRIVSLSTKRGIQTRWHRGGSLRYMHFDMVRN
ncbi:hypothetical protein T08_281 [Trichinella sp. T8]|nr:hypothetical protein T08_281 [Trichinella sp. T8]